MNGSHENRQSEGVLRNAAPSLGVALIVAFLAASLAPCPPPVRAQLAHTQHAPRVSCAAGRRVLDGAMPVRVRRACPDRR